MNTRLLMRASSVFTGVLGIAAIFAPQEILNYSGNHSSVGGLLLLQITGALYFGFAMLNWMAQANPLVAYIAALWRLETLPTLWLPLSPFLESLLQVTAQSRSY